MHPVRKPSEARLEPREEVIDNPGALDRFLPGGPGCPFIAELIDRVRGCLPAPRAAEVDDHLETCDVCRGHVAGFGLSAATAEAPGPAPKGAGIGEVWRQVREGPDASPEGSRPLARAVSRFRRDIRNEARTRAEQRLTVLVAELGERLRANAAWLFDRRGDELQAIVTHRSRMRHLVMRLGERGIVPHVAESRAGYLCNDVANDPYYRACIPDTRSELAVPVIALDGELLGVLNLESRQADTFRAAQVEELQAAASVLIPHLRVLADLDECPWHPEVHGWDLTQIFQRFCLAVVQGLNQPDGEDTASCTVWYADWAKDELFVYATSGYDIEYISELTLPMDSFSGRVAAGPPGRVWDTTPDRAPDFRRPDKAEQMGVRRILATPIHLPGAADRGISTLNVYFFADRPAATLPGREQLAGLARQLGALVAGFRSQRCKLATAYLHQRLLVQAPSSDAAFQTIKQMLMEVFAADGCSVFAHHAGQRRLYCVTTTGLDEAREAGPAGEPAHELAGSGAGRPVFYDLDRDHSFTTYLARHCGPAVRKNDVISTTEKGLPPDFPPRPMSKYREKFARSETEHRRFLGVGLDLPHRAPGEDSLLGIFRLNRSSLSRPFTRCDEVLLADLARLELCKKAFLDWMVSLIQPVAASPAAGRGREPGVIAAVASFLRPVPALGAQGTLTDELLQALVVIFLQHKIHSAGLVVGHQQAERLPFRWHAYHSLYHKTPPDDSEFYLKETAARLPREQLGGRRKIVTFNHEPLRCPDGHPIVAEAWVPLIAWNGRHLLEGMLALSFQQPIDSWTPDEFELLFHASRKLAAILAGTPHVIRPECFGLPAPVALERFLSFPREDRAIAADWTELRLRYGDCLETVARQGPGDGGAAEEWRPLRRGPAGEEAAFGIRERSDGRAFAFPLRLGPYDIGDLRCGIAGGDSLRRRDELIRTVPSLWSRLAFGMARFWEVLFRPRQVRPEVTVWDESLALSRIRPDLTRPLTPGRPPLVTDFDGPAGE